MEDMIRRIVEVDRRAQQVLDKAQQEYSFLLYLITRFNLRLMLASTT